MNLYPSIAQRKSCRAYDMRPLGQKTLDDIAAAIDGFDTLYPDSALEYRFAEKVKGPWHVEAPHYLIVSGQGKPGEMESAGFRFEQLILWLDAAGIGSVWLGASKDVEASTDNDLITIGFGTPSGPLHRSLDQFKRKPIEDVTNAPDDARMQAVHLAPSGMNTQPWYLEKREGDVLVYEKKLKPPISLAYKLSDIDMGIGLCHYALACKEAGLPFAFSRTEKLPSKSGYKPFGIIEA